jgi:membrane-associated phospholipid phosphatase
VPIALVVSVSTGRLYFGAHLPHDVLGGAAMGTVLGGSINLADRALPRCAPDARLGSEAEVHA